MAPPRATRSRYHVLPDQVSSRHRTIEIKLPYFMVKGNITIKRYHYYHAWGHKCTSKHYMVLESTTVTIATRRAASVPASIIKDVRLHTISATSYSMVDCCTWHYDATCSTLWHIKGVHHVRLHYYDKIVLVGPLLDGALHLCRNITLILYVIKERCRGT